MKPPQHHQGTGAHGAHHVGEPSRVTGEDPGVHVQTPEDPAKAVQRGRNSPESGKLLEEANTRTASAAEGSSGKAA